MVPVLQWTAKQGVRHNKFLCGLDVKDAFLMVVQPSTAWTVEWATTLVKPCRGLRHGFRKSLVERRVLQRRGRLSAFGLFLYVSRYLCISVYPLFRAAHLLYVSYDQMSKLVFVKWQESSSDGESSSSEDSFSAPVAQHVRTEKTGEGQRDKRPRPPGRPRGLSHQADRRFCFKSERLQLLRRFLFPKAQINQIRHKQIIQVLGNARAMEACQMHSYTRKMLCPVQRILQATPPFTGARRHLAQPGQRCNPFWTVWYLDLNACSVQGPSAKEGTQVYWNAMFCRTLCQMRIRQNIEEETWHRIYRKNETQHFVKNV